jgi:Ca2+-binding RTX toxin-like protein
MATLDLNTITTGLLDGAPITIGDFVVTFVTGDGAAGTTIASADIGSADFALGGAEGWSFTLTHVDGKNFDFDGFDIYVGADGETGTVTVTDGTTPDAVTGTVTNGATSTVYSSGEYDYVSSITFTGNDAATSDVIRVDNLVATVSATATAPAFDAGGATAISADENGAAVSLNAALAATDPDGTETLTWTVVSGPSRGTLDGFDDATQGAGTGVQSGAALTYTADSGDGADSFVVRVSDGTDTGTDDVTVTVGVSEAPTVDSFVLAEGVSSPTQGGPNGIVYLLTFTEAVSGLSDGNGLGTFDLGGDMDTTGLTVTVTSIDAVAGPPSFEPSAVQFAVTFQGAQFEDPTFSGDVFPILIDTGVIVSTSTGIQLNGTNDDAYVGETAVVDNVAPDAPVVTGVANDSAGANSDGTTTDGVSNVSPDTIEGTAEAGATVEVFLDTVSQGTVVADGTTGAWTFAYAGTTLTEGSYIITATATDAVGNVSADSTNFDLEIDQTVTAPTPDLTDASDAGSSSTDDLTSVATPTVSGTFEAGSNVQIDWGSGFEAGTTSATGSLQEFTKADPYTDGTYDVTFQVTDPAGNVATSSAPLSITIDTTGPDPIGVASISVDTGSNSSDLITSDVSPDISGSGAEPFAVVEVFASTVGSLGTVTADGSGDWTLTGISTLPEGSYTLTASQTDVAGNTSAIGASTSLQIDTSAPTGPTVVSVATDTAGADTAGTTSDGITNVSPTSFTGTSEAFATIEVFIGGLSDGSTVDADSNGDWTYTYAGDALNPGDHAVTATATDVAGNTSSASAEFDLVIDQSVAAPTPVLSTASNSGSTADTLTNDNVPTVEGTFEAGSKVEVDWGDAGFVVVTNSATGSLEQFTKTGGAYSDGAQTVTFRVTDPAGNVSTSSDLSLTIDTAPFASIDADAFTDNLSNDSTPDITGSGAQANAPIEVFANDGGGAVSLGTTTADGSGNWTLTSGSTLVDDTYTITVQQTDPAGNVSADGSGVTVEIDTAAPSAPVVDTVTDDTGGNGADGLTNDMDPVFSGTAVPESTVEVFVDGSSIGTVTATGGTWSIPSSTLTDGTYVVTATATDAAGNTSAASSDFTVEIDSTVDTPVIDITDATNSGATDDTITSDTTPVIEGTFEAGVAIMIDWDDTNGFVSSGTGTGSLQTFTSPTTFSDGDTPNVVLRVTDDAGNTADSASLDLVIDTSAATINLTSISEDTTVNAGTTSDLQTSDDTPSYSGSGAEVGATVEVFLDAGSVGTAVADGSGNWTVAASGTPLPDATYVVTVTQTDLAGNVSTPDAGQNMIIDAAGVTPPPVITDIASDTTGAGSTGTTTDGITSDAAVTVNGTGATNAGVVTLYIDGVEYVTSTATADASGNWSLTFTPDFAEGEFVLTASTNPTATDPSVQSNAFTVTIDQTVLAPTPTLEAASDTGVADGAETSDLRPTIEGTYEAGSGISIAWGNATSTATATGSLQQFTHPGADYAEGPQSIVITVTDPAGNVATAAALNIIVDTSDPSTIEADTFTDGLSNDDTPTYSGTSEASAGIEVFANDGSSTVSVGTATADGGGSWSVDSSVLADDAYTITVVQTDLAGNSSAAGSGIALEIDTVAATIVQSTLTNDSGANTSDGITNNASPTFDGTGAENGATITMYADDGSSNSAVGTATATNDSSGTWSITSTSPLPEGTYTVTFTQTDIAGNVSTVGTAFDLVVDMTDPADIAVSTMSTDSGINTGDGITNDDTPTLSGSGAEAGASVVVTLDDGSSQTALDAVTADGSGNWSVTSTTLSDESYSVTAVQTDTAGNSSVASTPFALVVDTASTTPGITGIQSDSVGAGSDGSNSDGITNAKPPVFDGTAEAGAFVEVYVNGVRNGDTVADGTTGAWTYAYSGVTLVDNSYTITAQATDIAGNLSSFSSDFVLVIDTTVVAAAPDLVGTGSNASDSGSFDDDDITNDAKPHVAGTFETGSFVEIDWGNGDGYEDFGQADGTLQEFEKGTSYTLTDNLGTFDVKFKITDPAGNQIESAALTINVDKASPTVTNPELTVDTGADNSDNLSNDPAAQITFAIETGESYVVDLGDGEGSQSLTGTGGDVSFTPNYGSDGIYDMTVTATDIAGNSRTKTLQVEIDRTAPTLSAIDLDAGSDSSPGLAALDEDDITNDVTPEITFTGEVQANTSVSGSAVTQVSVDWGDGDVDDATVSTASQSFTKDVAYATDGEKTVTVTQTDYAGNQSVQTVSITIDTTPTEITAISVVDGDDTGVSQEDNLTSNTDPQITFTLSEEAYVRFDANGGGSYSVNGTLGAGSLVAGTYTVSAGSPYADGTHTFQLQAFDLAGNVTLAEIELVIDTVAPVIDLSGLSASINEGSPPETTLGTVVMSDATDGSTIPPLSLTLLNDAGGLFEVFENTIRLSEDAVIDFETFTSLTIEAQLEDRAGNTSTASHTFAVADFVETVVGTEDKDFLIGTGSDDFFQAGSSADLLFGLGGADTLEGGANKDIVVGGAGNDILSGGSANDVLKGEGDDDQLYGGSGKDVLQGGDGNDYLSGGSGADVLQGGTGNDTLYGGANKDVLQGGDDNDTLWGGSADDVLQGNDGIDTLWGGTGKDILTGGAGADTFVFNLGDERDIITDMEYGSDFVTLDIELINLSSGNTVASVIAEFGSTVGDDYEFNFGQGDRLVFVDGAAQAGNIEIAFGIFS